MPVPPWEMGTAWPDGIRGLQKYRLLHQRLMADDTRTIDKFRHKL